MHHSLVTVLHNFQCSRRCKNFTFQNLGLASENSPSKIHMLVRSKSYIRLSSTIGGFCTGITVAENVPPPARRWPREWSGRKSSGISRFINHPTLLEFWRIKQQKDQKSWYNLGYHDYWYWVGPNLWATYETLILGISVQYACNYHLVAIYTTLLRNILSYLD